MKKKTSYRSQRAKPARSKPARSRSHAVLAKGAGGPMDLLPASTVTTKQAGVPSPAKTDMVKAGPREVPIEPAPSQDRARVAPWPSIDRYPVILGSRVTLSYIASVMRTCLTGYRREYVDLLDELLERDPHMYAVCAQRIHAVSGGELQITAAECEEKDEERAEEIRAYVDRCIKRIPDFQQAISQLQWGGVFYGVGASEITWGQDADGYYPARLHWIHSRRLNYPDAGSWSVRIWDQGGVFTQSVTTGNWPETPTANLFGVKADELPGKFIVHAPAVRGNYPTRDGLGRQVAIWSALKLMAARGGAQYIERFGKPWVVAYYKTAEKENEHRTADADDIAAAEESAKALGLGSLSSATLPDSVSLDIFGPAANAPGRQLFHKQFIDLCNSEISKAALGQTDTTEAGPNGSRGAVEVRKQGTQELYRYDAACLADTVKNDLTDWIVRINFPGEEHLSPNVKLHAAEEPDLNSILERAIKMAQYGAPVDADALAEEIGVPLAPKPDPQEILDAQLEADDLEDQQAEIDHNNQQAAAKQAHVEAVANHGTSEKVNAAAAKDAGMPHVPQPPPSAPVEQPFQKPLRPKRKLPTDTTRKLMNISPMKPYELQDFFKLQRGEELAPPPKPMLPTAEVAGGAAMGSAPGSQATPPKPNAPPGAPKPPPFGGKGPNPHA